MSYLKVNLREKGNLAFAFWPVRLSYGYLELLKFQESSPVGSCLNFQPNLEPSTKITPAKPTCDIPQKLINHEKN